MTPSPGWHVRLFRLAAFALAFLGQGILFLFMILTGLEIWPTARPGPGIGPWLSDAGLLLLFALQHSGMARRGFKNWLERRLPALPERSLYVGCSGLVTLLLALAWQPLPGPELWRGPTWLVFINVGALLGMSLCCLGFDPAGFFGLRQLWYANQLQPPEVLTIAGPYRFIRHPLMLCLLVSFWAQPLLTPTLAFLSGGLTLYILAALPLEERDLVRKFGQAYEDYRRRVPALIPWKRPLFKGVRSEE